MHKQVKLRIFSAKTDTVSIHHGCSYNIELNSFTDFIQIFYGFDRTIMRYHILFLHTLFFFLEERVIKLDILKTLFLIKDYYRLFKKMKMNVYISHYVYIRIVYAKRWYVCNIITMNSNRSSFQ